MKLQPASIKEIRRMSAGCLICASIETACYVTLSLLGITSVALWVLLASVLIGTLIAVCNFTLLCIMVQQAAAASDEKHRKALVRGSYNLRILVQAIWIVVAFAFPCFDLLASAIPLLFPTLIIYFLQVRGKLFENVTTTNRTDLPASVEEDSCSEEDLGPFET